MGVQERRSREKEELRELILDAAREIFVNDGYKNASIRKIAEKIEYSPTTIYTYFKDKGEMLDALCEETFTQLDTLLRRIHDEEACGIACIRKGLRAYIDFGLRHPHHYVLIFLVDEDSFYAGERAERKKKYGLIAFENLRKAVLRAHEAGQLATDDLETTAQALWAGAHGVTSLLISQKGFPFVDGEKLIEHLLDLLIDGVRKR